MILIRLMLCLLILSSCSKQQRKSDLSSFQLKGKVTVMSEYSYYANIDSGKLTKGEAFDYKVYVFDKEGYKKEFYQYGSNGYLDEKSIYRYDALGYQTGVKIENASGRILRREENKNAVDGKLRESVIYEANTKHIMRRLSYKYDSNGNNNEICTYDNSGKLIGKLSCNYDKKGNLTEETGWNENASLTGIKKNEYDKAGNKIKTELFDASMKPEESLHMKYDRMGNLTEMKSFGSDGKMSEKMLLEYEFDKTGNWIKKTVFINDIPQTIVERDISYEGEY